MSFRSSALFQVVKECILESSVFSLPHHGFLNDYRYSVSFVYPVCKIFVKLFCVNQSVSLEKPHPLYL